MKRITALGLLSLLFLSIQSLSAQNFDKKDFTGSWLGKVEFSGVSLRIVFNINLNNSDSLKATLDSPDQGAKDIPIQEVVTLNDSLIIRAPLLRLVYRGILKNDSTIDGTLTQSGMSFNCDVTKLRKGFSVNRPQEPKPPFPYITEDVTFANKKFKIFLAGTLTLPKGDGPFPAVILITGSGAQDRNESLMGHKPFLVIADWLTRKGIAVLRYDDRGVGKSQGNYSEATSADLATDAEAAFIFLKENQKINPKAIGLAGHSEGGIIAPVVAASNPGIAFVVSLAGTGVTGEEILYRQTSDIMKASRSDENAINAAIETNKKLYTIIKKEKDNARAEVKVMETYKNMLSGQNLTPAETEQRMAQIKASFGAQIYQWYRYFLTTDPAKYWKKVRCPVLALNGDRDLQVACDVNLPAIEKALRAGGNKNVKTVVLPGLNHLFQHCETGIPAEYSQIEETFSEEALQIISDWIVNLKVSR